MSTAQYRPSTVEAPPADGAVTGSLGAEQHEPGTDADRASVRLAPCLVGAVVLDADRVLTDSQPLRVIAWQDTLDAYLAQYAHVTGRPQGTLDATSDLPAHLTGRLDTDIAAALLAARPVAADLAAQHLGPSDEDLLRLLVRHEDQRFEELLRSQGAPPRTGAVRLLLALRAAGIRTAAVSTSLRGELLLRRAGLADLVDLCVDAGDAAHYGLAGPPDPGLYELAMRLLRTAPERSVLLVGTPLGTAAGMRAGFGRTAAVTFAHDTVAFEGEEPPVPWPGPEPLVCGLGAVTVAE
ncbi:HAD family hydrolase [Kitasatospora sp. NPDC088548]|uniref:HAD family hydrolase n=1 Tax=Kitasatospora sp. NPDC088548 TaxID=3364075 RepID=UPI00380205C5